MRSFISYFRKPLQTRFLYFIFFALALTVILITYLPILDAFFVADDFHYLRRWSFSALLKNFAVGRHKVFYRPLGDLFFFIQFSLFKVNQIGYHVVNLIVHVINSFLLLIILQRFVSSLKAVVATSLFMLAPIHARILPWISNQFEICAALLMLLILFEWLNALQTPFGVLRKRAYVYMVLALWTKGTAIAIPLVLWIVIIGSYYLQNHTRDWLIYHLKKSLWFLGVVSVFLAYRYFFLGSIGVYGNATHLRFDRIIPIHLMHYYQTIISSFIGYELPLSLKIGIGVFFAWLILIATSNLRTTILLLLSITFLLPAANLEGERFVYLSTGFFIAFLVSLLPDVHINTRTYIITACIIALLLSHEIVLTSQFLPYWRIAGETVLKVPFYVMDHYKESHQNLRLFFINLPEKLGDVIVFGQGIAIHGICMMVLKIPTLKSFILSWNELSKLTTPPAGTSYHFFEWKAASIEPVTALDELFASYAAQYNNQTPTIAKSWDFKTQEASEWTTLNELRGVEKNGRKYFLSIGYDPYLLIYPIAINKKAIRYISINCAVTADLRTAPGAIFWITEQDLNWNEKKSIKIPIVADGTTREYRIDFLSNPAWLQGDILTGLRFDPLASPGTITVDSISLLPPSSPSEYTISIPLEFHPI